MGKGKNRKKKEEANKEKQKNGGTGGKRKKKERKKENRKQQETSGNNRKEIENERKREETRGNEFCSSHFCSNGTLLERVAESDFVVCCPFAPSEAGSWSVRGGVSRTTCPRHYGSGF